MPLPEINGQPLVPESRILRHGPKRLKKAQGFHRDPKTGIWTPKIKPAVPDPFHRALVLAAQAEVAGKPMPQEAKPFDLSTYRPLPGRVLLRVGDEVKSVDGVHIPDASQQRDEVLTVVVIGDRPNAKVEFRVGDRITLDRNTHKKPVSFDGHPPMVLVKSRSVATVIS